MGQFHKRSYDLLQNFLTMKIFILLIYGFIQMLLMAKCYPQNISGNWYFFEKDSLYIEAYINDSLLTLNHPLAGLATNLYIEKSESIILFDKQIPVDTIKILKHQTDSIVLLARLDTIKLYKIYEIDNFHDIKFHEEKRMQEFIDKYNKRLKSHSNY